MRRPCADLEEKREPRGGCHSKEDLPYKPQSEKAVSATPAELSLTFPRARRPRVHRLASLTALPLYPPPIEAAGAPDASNKVICMVDGRLPGFQRLKLLEHGLQMHRDQRVRSSPLMTCLRCGRVHFAMTRAEIEAEVASFNRYMESASPQTRAHFGNRTASLADYERCRRCGATYREFHPAVDNDAPDGVTLNPIMRAED
jgi:ribosomal protein L37E